MKVMKKKVSGYSNLYKNTDTGVIDNCESIERQRYLSAKQQAMMNLSSQTEIAKLKDEISVLKEALKEIDDIKKYLKISQIIS